MLNFNLHEINNQLPPGAKAEIAARMRVPASVVSDVLLHGRKGRHTNAVVAIALELIDQKKPNPDVMSKAKEMNLTQTYIEPSSGHRYSRKKSVEPARGLSFENIILVVGVIVAGVIGLVWWKNKSKTTGGVI